MPPAPQIKINLNEEEIEKVCESLGIERPTIKVIMTQSRPKTLGCYRPKDGLIQLFDHESLSMQHIAVLKGQFVTTLLHELRHAWQHQTGNPVWKNEVQREMDAEQWAKKHRWTHSRIISISRRQPRTGFSRLSRHDRRNR